MTPDSTRIRRLITEFKFKPLFVEELGWEDLRSAPLTVTVDGQSFTLRGVAEKRGLVLLQCDALPPYAMRRRIDHEVTKVHREHLIVFAAADKSAQVWLWVRREPGKPTASRERHHHRGETGERVAQTLAQISFSLEEEEELTLFGSISRVKAAFDVDRVTKKFYERFKKEHAAFLQFIHGIPDDGFQRWYASVMLNRLMFIYFVQRKGFMDGDAHYLRQRLAQAEQNNGNYYRDFLCVLFFQGFAVRETERSAEVNRLLGRVPYLNGGLFAVHTVEERYGDAITIENAAFAQLFAFFDDYNWHLDERPLRNDKEINPDVLGYIFEKYINQKQMGAYYTKEDITDYIGKNTILPYLLDAVRRDVPAAFDASADLDVMLGKRSAADAPTVWRLLAEDPDRYIYPAMQHGVREELPDEISSGIDDVSQRTQWNRSAPPEVALPTEIWREVVARRQRYAEVRGKLTSGAVTHSDDLITLNLNIRQFARDVIDTCEEPALLRAFWHALRSLAVLDPTGGSGAFLFAALTILEDLYDACLERMEWFLAEQRDDTRLHDFAATLAEVARHPNRRYFILKSIIVHNLYAVDIMEEAVEICKLRLFLKLVAQIDRADQIEPLPDIDFNIRAGNTLVGFVSREDVRAALELEQRGTGAAQGKLIFGEEQSALERIEQKAQAIDRAFAAFRALQTQIDAPAATVGEAKARLKAKLRTLEDELNRLLARVYGVKVGHEVEYRRWLASHKPFHWFVEFYGVLQKGGFDVIVGNPPWKEYAAARKQYTVTGYQTERSGNLYAMCIERSIALLRMAGRFSFIVQLPLVSSSRMVTTRSLMTGHSASLHIIPFDDRPGKLFDGLEHCRSSIFVLRRDGDMGSEVRALAGYQRWFTEARSFLFDSLSYTSGDVTSLPLDNFPKLANSVHLAVLEKLWKHIGSMVENVASGASGAHFIFYQEATQYWVKASIGYPYYAKNGVVGPQPHGRQIWLSDMEQAEVVFAAVNSSLFYLYFVTYSDCFHLSSNVLLSFPIPYSIFLDSRIAGLGRSLMEELKATAEHKEISTKSGDRIAYEEFSASKCKPIIDEIDRVLARHYGFTDEELDYILNYDIKYRLGAEDGE